MYGPSIPGMQRRSGGDRRRAFQGGVPRTTWDTGAGAFRRGIHPELPADFFAGPTEEGKDTGGTAKGDSSAGSETSSPRTLQRGDRVSRPVVPTPCPGFLGGFPLGLKANAEAAVWRGHAANTTTFFRPVYDDSEEDSTRSGRPLFRRVKQCCEHPIDGNPWPAGARADDKRTARRR